MDLLQYIPHRPPFLWIDRITSCRENSLEAEKYINPDLPVLAGHYPGHPLMPGVLLCEAVFQAGAVMIAAESSGKGNIAGRGNKLPVLTRIENARFKQQVLPGDTIHIRVDLIEVVGPAWFMKGKVAVNGRTALTVRFTCALVPSE